MARSSLRRALFALLPATLVASLACAPAHSDPAKSPRPPAAAAPRFVGVTDSVNTKTRTVTPLAPGVYAIRHPDAPDTFPQGNTTVVIGDREVLVVDSCYLPSSAREDIAQIKQWTHKPVRHLVNTHWHFDHTMGNAAYADAFPGLAIVAHVETQKQMAGYNPGWFERFPKREARFRDLLAKGSAADGKPFTEGEKEELRTAIAGVAPVAAEFAPLAARVGDLTPTISFERELAIDLGHRRVQVLFLGRGNTLGDAVVYLPDDKIVATGDLLDHPVPYLGGGYPVEEVATLEALARLDARTIVPGHGDVLHDKEHLGLVIELLRTVVGAVDKQVQLASDRRDLDGIRKAVLASVDLTRFRERMAGGARENVDFFDDFAVDGAIKAAHAEMWPR